MCMDNKKIKSQLLLIQTGKKWYLMKISLRIIIIIVIIDNNKDENYVEAIK